MKEQYDEYEIRYDEAHEKFEAFKGEERVASSAKLSDLRKRLDRVGIVRAKFAKFKVLAVTSGSRYGNRQEPRIVEYEVTSVVSKDEVWLTCLEDKSRKKDRLGGYTSWYADTPENRIALAAIVDLYKQRDALDSRISTELKLAAKATVPSGVEKEEE